jgi:hypothetical protein
MRRRVVCVTVVAHVAVLEAVVPHAVLHAQSFRSARLAWTLTSLLDYHAVYTFAAPDPDEPGRFVAASYIPGGQLLVLSARHPSVDAIVQRIANGRYRDVYLDLQATPTRTGKFFVQDARANGLLHRTEGAVDIVYENGAGTIAFNGDPEAQGLTAAEYDARFDRADQRYAHMLRVLIDSFQAHKRPPDAG